MSRRLIACLAATAVAVPAVGATAVSAHKGDDKGHDSSGPLFAVLKGQKELTPDGMRGAGDPEGVGSATVLIHKGMVCFGITVSNIATPVAAHIHQGTRDVNGPIVVPLTAPVTGDPGASSGCVPVPEEMPHLASEIQDHPRAFYVNVHTADFPAGAVRGQLHRR